MTVGNNMQFNKLTSLLSVLMGTILEWYDFALLGAMAPIISHLFFPSDSKTLSLLATFGVFASGFIMRPIGGIIFGHIGDTLGRKTALSLTIIIMAIPTTLIGLLPTYEVFGIFSAIALISLRLIQGFASSGEYPGAICFLSEIAPSHRKGFFGSISMFGVVGGVFLGSLTSSALLFFLTTEQMYSWGWRIPFLMGLPLGVTGLYLRYRVQESELFEAIKLTKKVSSLPFIDVCKYNWQGLLKIIILFSLPTISFYMSFIYIGAYLVSTNKISLHTNLLSNSIGTLVLLVLIPAFGYLSDKIKKQNIMLVAIACLMIFFYPIFNLILSDFPYGIFVGQILLAFFIAMLAGPLAITTAETFTTEMRYTGISAGLNIGASIFGGTTPLIATYLLFLSDNQAVPTVYPILFAVLSFFLLTFRFTCPAREKLK